MNHSVAEIKAVAEAAIIAKQTADAAKTALEADPDNADLQTALKTAETSAADAKAKADALSQEPDPVEKKKAKLLKKQGIIKSQLKTLGVDDDEDDDDDDDDEDNENDPNRPVTFGDLQRMNARAATKTVLEMADAIADAGDKEAVKTALKQIIPSGDVDKDFKNAVAIANIDRNSKILEEVTRRPDVRRTHTSTGAAPLREEPFTPTALEASYMGAPFNLNKEDILKARTNAPKPE